MYQLSDLTIACSTFCNRLVGALAVLQSVRLASKDVTFLAVHQVPEGETLDSENRLAKETLLKDENVLYFPYAERGLTRSRNRAIEKAKTKFIWFLDDDVVVSDGIFDKLLTAFNTVPFSGLTIESQKVSGGPRTRFPSHLSELTSRAILRVASFELIADREFLINNGVRFREDMGVGSKATTDMGEESVFLADIRRQGGQLTHYAVSGCTHPDVSTGVIISERNLYSKGVTIKRCFKGFERIRFYFKDLFKLLKNRNDTFGPLRVRLKLIRSLTKGVF